MAEERLQRDDHSVMVFTRLKKDVGLQAAQAAMTDIARRLEAEYPATNRGLGVSLVRLQEDVVREVRPALLVLAGCCTAWGRRMRGHLWPYWWCWAPWRRRRLGCRRGERREWTLLARCATNARVCQTSRYEVTVAVRRTRRLGPLRPAGGPLAGRLDHLGRPRRDRAANVCGQNTRPRPGRISGHLR